VVVFMTAIKPPNGLARLIRKKMPGGQNSQVE
jgi:hypothetical protein